MAALPTVPSSARTLEEIAVRIRARLSPDPLVAALTEVCRTIFDDGAYRSRLGERGDVSGNELMDACLYGVDRVILVGDTPACVQPAPATLGGFRASEPARGVIVAEAERVLAAAPHRPAWFGEPSMSDQDDRYKRDGLCARVLAAVAPDPLAVARLEVCRAWAGGEFAGLARAKSVVLAMGFAVVYIADDVSEPLLFTPGGCMAPRPSTMLALSKTEDAVVQPLAEQALALARGDPEDVLVKPGV